MDAYDVCSSAKRQSEIVISNMIFICLNVAYIEWVSWFVVLQKLDISQNTD